jgi:hypothetical protein
VDLDCILVLGMPGKHTMPSKHPMRTLVALKSTLVMASSVPVAAASLWVGFSIQCHHNQWSTRGAQHDACHDMSMTPSLHCCCLHPLVQGVGCFVTMNPCRARLHAYTVAACIHWRRVWDV